MSGKRKKSQIRWGRLILVLGIVAIIVASIVMLVVKFLPNMRHTSLLQQNGVDNSIAIVVEDEVNFVNSYEVVQYDDVYVPVTIVQQYIDEYVFVEGENITITTENTVIRMLTDELTYYVNETPMTLTVPIYRENDVEYMPKSLLQTLYNVDIEYSDEYNIVTIVYTDTDSEYGMITKTAKMRVQPDIKSEILSEVNEGTPVEVYGTEGEFVKIRDSYGNIGYINANKIAEIHSVAGTTEKKQRTPQVIDGGVVMLWDQVTTVQANRNDNRRVVHEGVNVLSPTWFSFDTNTFDGTIISIADSSYVEFAHANNVQVWALITDNFSRDISNMVLTDYDTRQYVIKQLLAYVSMYNLDGINIDFEAVRLDDADYFIQFLRELYPQLKAQNCILSVDTFVPMPYSMYYNRKAIAETSDYVAVMTYDEHTSNSNVTGPVASLQFVDDGIKNTLLEVPKEQTIMGIPLYTRVWRVKESGDFTIQNYSMDIAYDMFTENNATFTWDAERGYTYAEYTVVEDGETIKYEAWLEDENSLELKLAIYDKYDLAGVALWKRGLEQESTYGLVNKYVEN